MTDQSHMWLGLLPVFAGVPADCGAPACSGGIPSLMASHCLSSSSLCTTALSPLLLQVRVDIEKCPVIAEECLIMDVPAVQIFKGGVEREALRGRVSMAELWDKLKHYMEH